MKKENNHNFINQTQEELKKVDLDLYEVENIFNEIAEAIADRKINQSYLALKYLTEYIEDFVKFKEKDIEWYERVAKSCLIIKKNIIEHKTIIH